jgi:hypothetical protein
MSRVASQAIIDAIGKQTVQYYECIHIDVSTGIYITNSPTDITFDGQTYTAFGHLLGFDSITENTRFQIPSINISISGIAPYALTDGSKIIPALLDNTYIERDATITRVFYDHDAYIGGFEMFAGKISNVTIKISIDGATTAGIEVSSHWSDFKRATGRQTNPTSQQYHFPGDEGFEYSKNVQKEINWQKP